MKVKAKFPNGKFGFYAGRRVRSGEVFTLSDESDFSEYWMVKIEEEKPTRRGRPKKTDDEGEGGE